MSSKPIQSLNFNVGSLIDRAVIPHHYVAVGGAVEPHRAGDLEERAADDLQVLVESFHGVDGGLVLRH